MAKTNDNVCSQCGANKDVTQMLSQYETEIKRFKSETVKKDQKINSLSKNNVELTAQIAHLKAIQADLFNVERQNQEKVDNTSAEDLVNKYLGKKGK